MKLPLLPLYVVQPGIVQIAHTMNCRSLTVAAKIFAYQFPEGLILALHMFYLFINVLLFGHFATVLLHDYRLGFYVPDSE